MNSKDFEPFLRLDCFAFSQRQERFGFEKCFWFRYWGFFYRLRDFYRGSVEWGGDYLNRVWIGGCVWWNYTHAHSWIRNVARNNISNRGWIKDLKTLFCSGMQFLKLSNDSILNKNSRTYFHCTTMKTNFTYILFNDKDYKNGTGQHYGILI